MRNQFKSKLIALFSILTIVLVGVGVSSTQKTNIEIKADEAIATSVIFNDHLTSHTNQYTGTIAAKNGDIQWSIHKFSDNNGAWNVIASGHKTNAIPDAHIKTTTIIPEAITKVVVNVTQLTSANSEKINSVKLKVASNAAFTTGLQTINGPIPSGTGSVTYVVPNPTENQYYSLEYDFNAGSANGYFRTDKVDYYYESAGPIPVLQSISVTTQPTKKTYLNGEAFDKTGMVVKANYDIGGSVTIDNNQISVTPETLSLGQTNVTLGWEGKTTNVTGLSVIEAIAGTIVYDIIAKNTLSSVGPIPTGSSASLVETYGTSKQMTANNSQTVTFTNYGNIKITKITLSARSNANGGAGSFVAIVDGVETTIIPTSNYNTTNWYGSYSTTYDDVVKDVDITVSSTLKFVVAATANSLYVESYTLEWEEVEEEPLEAISINKSTATIVEGEEETFFAIPTPASADNSVTWSSSKTSVATVDSDGKVSAHIPGTAVITAKSTINPSISGSVTVMVIAAEYLSRVTSLDDLYVGAHYILANAASTHAIANAVTANYISAAEAKFPEIDDEQVLKYSDALMKIELGEASGGRYSLKTISSEENLDEKYIYAAGNKKGDNYLRLADELSTAGHWSISFVGEVLTMVADVDTEAEISGTLRFNNSTKGFAAYLGASVDAIDLYLDESSIPVDPNYVDAEEFADWIMSHPSGNITTPECASKYANAKTKWGALSAGAKEAFKDHANFLDARNRLEKWAIANGETIEYFYSGVSGGQEHIINDRNTLGAVAIISILSLTTITGYYFLKRKEKAIVG